MSQSAIARETGVPRGTVRDWLAGKLPRPAGQTALTLVDISALDERYAYLLGMYLGDGYIAPHQRGVFRLRISLDSRYPAIIEETRAAMQAVSPDDEPALLQLKGCHQVSSYSRRWPLYFPQHGPGKKHERRIVLTGWQREIVARDPRPLLRGLIHSDGCRFVNTGTNWRHPRYSFSNRSEDIRGIFTAACNELGLRWTGAPHTIYVSRKADVARMDEFIGPKT